MAPESETLHLLCEIKGCRSKARVCLQDKDEQIFFACLRCADELTTRFGFAVI